MHLRLLNTPVPQITAIIVQREITFENLKKLIFLVPESFLKWEQHLKERLREESMDWETGTAKARFSPFELLPLTQNFIMPEALLRDVH